MIPEMNSTTKHVPSMPDADIAVRMTSIEQRRTNLRDAEELAVWALLSWRWTEWVPDEPYELWSTMLDERSGRSVARVRAAYVEDFSAKFLITRTTAFVFDPTRLRRVGVATLRDIIATTLRGELT